MHKILANLVQSFELTGNMKRDVHHFLTIHHYPKIAEHSLRVGNEARRLAVKFNADPTAAEISGFLHDVSVVFPNQERVKIAHDLGIEVLPEEEQFPLIVHQKISKVMAKQIFGIDDSLILEAIGCHTTLKSNPTKLDLVLFVADKIKWDQPGNPPYIDRLKEQTEVSLEHGAFAYLQYMWQKRKHLKVVHPWLKEAYFELKERV